MKTVRSFFGQQIWQATIYALLAFVMLFTFFALFDEIGDLGKGGYKIHHALRYVILNIPGRIYDLIPVATMIGAVYAFSRIAAQSEYTIFRAAGLSGWRMVGMLFWIGLPIVVISVLLGEYVVPRTDNAASELKLKVKLSAGGSSRMKSGFWFRDIGTAPIGQSVPGLPAINNNTGKTTRFVNIRRFASSGAAEWVRLYEFDQDLQLRTVIRAQEARFAGAGRLVLSKVVLTDFDPAAMQPNLPEQVLNGTVGLPTAARIRELPELELTTELSQRLVAANLFTVDRMPITALNNYIAHLRGTGQSTQRYEIALWRKLGYPLGVIVMLILALPAAYVQVRAGGVGMKLFVGVLAGLGFYTLQQLVSSFGTLATWPPALAVFAPAILTFILGIFTIKWLERV